MSRTTRRLSAALLAIGLVSIAAPASAHVHVDSTDATRGGFGVATFRVPNESDDAATTKVTVTLPKDTPFAFVSAQAKPGWKASASTEKLDEPVKNGDFDITEVTTSITWTATGDGLAPGQYDTFGISGGPFPDTAELVLPTTQTYADGEVVKWDQEQTGEKEPEKPAPVLALAAADDVESGAAATSTVQSEVSEDEGSGVALTISIAAAVLAAGALLVSLRQNRRDA